MDVVLTPVAVSLFGGTVVGRIVLIRKRLATFRIAGAAPEIAFFAWTADKTLSAIGAFVNIRSNGAVMVIDGLAVLDRIFLFAFREITA